ncbi:hypothetical protein DLREEDagrD3_02340 [Denitratisoma sp. agr-D3]
MTTSRQQTPAEHRAAVEAAARDRLDQGKQALEALREQELAEAEALALARIRIQTDQMLAKQAEALADAERKTERVAIERRAADIEATKAARLRLEKEEQARLASAAKQAAQAAAAEAAREKAEAQAALAESRAARRALADKPGQGVGRWAALRNGVSRHWRGLLVAAFALVLGWAAWRIDVPRHGASSLAQGPQPRAGDTAALRLSRELGALPEASSTPR